MHGVYISFPFCRQKCTYCNFASGVFAADLQADYLDALCREIEAARDFSYDTLYFGGGTPSLLEHRGLRRVLAALRPPRLKEFTLEAAPGDLSTEKAELWADLGVNRVSFGVQSFDSKIARSTGRRHTAQTVAEEVARLRAAGITRINVDLIAGLAWQTEANWRSEFDWIERLGIRHVSVYMLEADDESRLGAELRQGGSRFGASAVPSEDQIADLYQEAVERLRSLGIDRYEISNFAAAGHESLHNRKYWTMQPYVGFGADAHSFDGRTRWANARQPGEYAARSQAGQSLRVTEETAGEDRRTDDLLMTGLRTREGVTLPPAAAARLRPQIDQLSALGWLEEDGANGLRLTDSGVLYSNEALQQLLLSPTS